MRYICGTPELLLTLNADKTNIFKWWVDLFHIVYPNCNVQTEETQSLGEGSTIRKFTKQKLNNISSTKIELVSVDEIIPNSMWTSYFFNYQGYKVRETIIY